MFTDNNAVEHEGALSVDENSGVWWVGGTNFTANAAAENGALSLRGITLAFGGTVRPSLLMSGVL